MIDPTISPHAASFRDPAGYVFEQAGVIKRTVTEYGRANYDLMMSSGLYRVLTEQGLLVAHREDSSLPVQENIYKTLIPERITHISYPYEWSFAQLKDAALVTLQIQKLALQHGMSLKDASGFNIQFQGPRPVFIDTLSFEADNAGPWVAYGQFCMHFLAPLALMAKVSVDFGRSLRIHLDGIPLDLASRILPRSTWLKFGLLMHLHMHARSRRKYSGVTGNKVKKLQSSNVKVNKAALVESLESAIQGLELPDVKTEWIDYYKDATHYSDAANRFKHDEVVRLTQQIGPSKIYDLGGNVGTYSRLLTALGIDCVCYDIDPLCVNENYLRSKQNGDSHMLPLLADLTNPTPGLGFALDERASIIGRSDVQMVLALAVVHHLRITGNIPMVKIARFLAQLAPAVLIEFVPKQDSQSQILIGNRPDIFHDYTYEGFLEAFGQEFELRQSVPIPETGGRHLCLFRAR